MFQDALDLRTEKLYRDRAGAQLTSLPPSTLIVAPVT